MKTIVVNPKRKLKVLTVKRSMEISQRKIGSISANRLKEWIEQCEKTAKKMKPDSNSIYFHHYSSPCGYESYITASFWVYWYK